MIVTDDVELEQGEDFKLIRLRIARTASLPIDNLGQSTGAPIDETMYPTPINREHKDDLVSIFRRMLDLGSPEYEHDLATFLHNGPPNMDHVKVERGGKIYGKGDPIREAAETEYFEEKRKQKERDARIAEKLNTIVVTNKQDLRLNISPSPNLNGKSDFGCYIPNCKFATNDRDDYERHIVTKHPSGTLCYPGKIDLKMRGWKAQGRKWEI